MPDLRTFLYAISDRAGVHLAIVEHNELDWWLELHVVERHGSQVVTRVIELARFTDYKRALVAHRWLADAFEQINRARGGAAADAEQQWKSERLGGFEPPKPFDPKTDIPWDQL